MCVKESRKSRVSHEGQCRQRSGVVPTGHRGFVSLGNANGGAISNRAYAGLGEHSAERLVAGRLQATRTCVCKASPKIEHPWTTKVTTILIGPISTSLTSHATVRVPPFANHCHTREHTTCRTNHALHSLHVSWVALEMLVTTRCNCHAGHEQVTATTLGFPAIAMFELKRKTSLCRRRRNQVLNDALSRLTSVDAYATETGTMGSLSAVSTKTAGEGGNGFPIPRLIDRGRELAASLGGKKMSIAIPTPPCGLRGS